MNCVFVHQNKKVYQDAICIFSSVQLDELGYHQQNYGIRIKTFEHIKIYDELTNKNLKKII